MKHGLWGRRTLMSGVGAVAAAFALGGQTAAGQTPASPFQPARHAQDDWLDKVPGKHRVIFDITSADGMSEAMGFANNFFTANKNGYGLNDSDLAVVVCLRHQATVFAFNDAIWARHGKAMADAVKYTNSRSTEPPVVNPYNAAPRAALDTLAKRGVQFAVCDMASHRFARMLAGADGDADAMYKDMAAHAIPNTHFVPAGVVGVTRAQEYGYSVLHAG